MSKKKTNKTRQANLPPEKVKAISARERLLREITEAPPTGPMVTSLTVWDHFRRYVEFYLQANDHSDHARDQVAQMAFQFRKLAYERFGHDTAETFELAGLIRGPSGVKRKRPDVLTFIRENAPRRCHLDVHQAAAADNIRMMWGLFQKVTGLRSTDLLRAGGGSGKILQVADLVTEDEWKHYVEVWTPWIGEAQKIEVVRLEIGKPVTVAALVFKLLVEDFYPHELDEAFFLRKGRSLRVLRCALWAYEEPHRLADLTNPPKPPQPSRDASGKGSGGSDVQSPSQKKRSSGRVLAAAPPKPEVAPIPREPGPHTLALSSKRTKAAKALLRERGFKTAE